jgi:hypothetical protein
MAQIIELIKKFRNLVVALFFLLGALLVLLGVTEDLNLPILNQLALDANFRWACLTLGVLCLIASLFILYRPPNESEQVAHKANNIIGTIPDELTMSYSRRLALLSPRQAEILTYLVHAGEGGQFITQDMIEKAFSQYGDGLLYRLEHLRLLGFLVRHKLGHNVETSKRFAYSISPDYLKEIGDFEQLSLVGAYKSAKKRIAYGSQGPRDNLDSKNTTSKKEKKK